MHWAGEAMARPAGTNGGRGGSGSSQSAASPSWPQTCRGVEMDVALGGRGELPLPALRVLSCGGRGFLAIGLLIGAGPWPPKDQSCTQLGRGDLGALRREGVISVQSRERADRGLPVLLEAMVTSKTPAALPPETSGTLMHCPSHPSSTLPTSTVPWPTMRSGPSVPGPGPRTAWNTARVRTDCRGWIPSNVKHSSQIGSRVTSWHFVRCLMPPICMTQ
mmetsp:Transcript_110293/g.191065  ORF Transcript_110293/g.191065 Transcript_110293/m.191065 type:complete len:219 (+) Transcript_110293:61-717(+)